MKLVIFQLVVQEYVLGRYVPRPASPVLINVGHIIHVQTQNDSSCVVTLTNGEKPIVLGTLDTILEAVKLS